MQNETDTDETQTATVSEFKFNGTATLTVTADDKRAAKYAARRFFEEKHGSSPSKVLVEEDGTSGSAANDGIRFTVMVADHSSGSLIDAEEYEI